MTTKQQPAVNPDLGKLTTLGVSKFTKTATKVFQQGCTMKGDSLGTANVDELLGGLIKYYMEHEFTDDEKKGYDNALQYATGCRVATWSDLDNLSKVARKTRQDTLKAAKAPKAAVKASAKAAKSSSKTKKTTK